MAGKRVILDACMPRVFGRSLTDHTVTTLGQLGLQALDDGEMLDAIAPECDVFVTVDKGIPWQQRLAHRPFAVVLLRCKSNRLEALLPLVPSLAVVLENCEAGQFHEISQ